jgi:hypothetical protein
VYTKQTEKIVNYCPIEFGGFDVPSNLISVRANMWGTKCSENQAMKLQTISRPRSLPITSVAGWQIVVPMLLAVAGASAIVRYEISNMSCAEVQALVRFEPGLRKPRRALCRRSR